MRTDAIDRLEHWVGDYKKTLRTWEIYSRGDGLGITLTLTEVSTSIARIITREELRSAAVDIVDSTADSMIHALELQRRPICTCTLLISVKDPECPKHGSGH